MTVLRLASISRRVWGTEMMRASLKRTSSLMLTFLSLKMRCTSLPR